MNSKPRVTTSRIKTLIKSLLQIFHSKLEFLIKTALKVMVTAKASLKYSYYKAKHTSYTKWISLSLLRTGTILLQSGTAFRLFVIRKRNTHYYKVLQFVVITNWDDFITKWDSVSLLQSGTAFRYYKVGQRFVITKWDSVSLLQSGTIINAFKKNSSIVNGGSVAQSSEQSPFHL